MITHNFDQESLMNKKLKEKLFGQYPYYYNKKSYFNKGDDHEGYDHESFTKYDYDYDCEGFNRSGIDKYGLDGGQYELHLIYCKKIEIKIFF